MSRSRRPGRSQQEADMRRRFPSLFLLGDRLAELQTAHGVSRERIWKILFPGKGSLFQGGGILTGLVRAVDLSQIETRLRLYERARMHLLEQHPGLELDREAQLYSSAVRSELRRLDGLLSLLRRCEIRARWQVVSAKLNPTRPWGIPVAELKTLTPAEWQPRATRQLKRWPILGDRAHALAQYLSTIIRPRRTWVSRGGSQPYTTDVLELVAELLDLAYPFLPKLSATDVKNRIANRRRPPAKVVRAHFHHPA